MSTEGSLPRVYDAVNSHGNPDLWQRVHGHRPVHLVFFLLHRSHALLTRVRSLSSLLLFADVDCWSLGRSDGVAPVGALDAGPPLVLAGVHSGSGSFPTLLGETWTTTALPFMISSVHETMGRRSRRSGASRKCGPGRLWRQAQVGEPSSALL